MSELEEVDIGEFEKTPEFLARSFAEAVQLYVFYNNDPIDNKCLTDAVENRVVITEDICTPIQYLKKFGLQY